TVADRRKQVAEVSGCHVVELLVTEHREDFLLQRADHLSQIARTPTLVLDLFGDPTLGHCAIAPYRVSRNHPLLPALFRRPDTLHHKLPQPVALLPRLQQRDLRVGPKRTQRILSLEGVAEPP